MSYEFWFYILIAFIVGRVSTTFNIYIGSNKEKYDNASIGILLKEKE